MLSETWQIPWSRVTLLELLSRIERYRCIIQPLASGCLLDWVNLCTRATPPKGQQLGWEHLPKRGSARSTQAMAKGPGSLWEWVRRKGL